MRFHASEYVGKNCSTNARPLDEVPLLEVLLNRI